MMKTYVLTKEQLEHQMTKAAHGMIEHLGNIGLIDRQKANELMRTKIVVIRKKSQICHMWRRMFGNTDTEIDHILVATIQDLGNPDE